MPADTQPGVARAFRAMASEVTFFVVGASPDAESALNAAQAEVQLIEAACTRFEPGSELSRLNRLGRLDKVDPLLLAVLETAYDFYLASGGRFDPRVLGDLEALGYDRTFGDVSSEVQVVPHPRLPLSTWRPRIEAASSTVCLDGTPIDLGGIAKGFAADAASSILEAAGLSGLVDLGGDGRVFGSPGPVSLGVEDPFGEGPCCVLELTEGAFATTSTRIRSWIADGEPVHHLIDPGTGKPGGAGLVAVTILARTVTEAEIAAKVAFLESADGIAAYLESRSLTGMWITGEAQAVATSNFSSHVVWSR